MYTADRAAIEYNPEPEQVCYCTSNSSYAYLKLT